ITQENFTTANERTRICSFPGSLETALQLTRHDSLGATGVFDDLVRKHIMKLYARSEWRILRFWLHGEVAFDLAVCCAGRNFRKLQHVGFVPERRPKLLQKKTVLQRNSRHLRIAVQCRRAADVGTKIETLKAREQLAGPIQKTKTAVLDA